MARLRSGILGNIRGKVSGVVGGQYKDKNYLREYVKPANPNTAAQQTQRGLLADAVAFCKPLVGPIFNAYYDKFLKSYSGFNAFIKKNIDEFPEPPDAANIVLCEGKLSTISNLSCTYNAGTGAVAISWAANPGNNGANTDKIFWAIRDQGTGIWYFADGERERSDLGDTQTLPAGLTVLDLDIWVLAAQYTGSLVTMLSNSYHADVAVP
jgi:hypothetical protein